MNIIGNVAAVPGVAGAARIGVDGMTPHDGAPAARRARRRRARRRRGAPARRAPGQVAGRRRGVCAPRWPSPATRSPPPSPSSARAWPRCELKAAFEAGMAAHGVTTPSVEGTFNSVFPGPGALAKGELVPIRAGVVADGWEGTVVATYVCATPPEERRASLGEALEQCRPGRTVGDVRNAARRHRRRRRHGARGARRRRRPRGRDGPRDRARRRGRADRRDRRRDRRRLRGALRHGFCTAPSSVATDHVSRRDGPLSRRDGPLSRRDGLGPRRPCPAGRRASGSACPR